MFIWNILKEIIFDDTELSFNIIGVREVPSALCVGSQLA